MSQFIEDLLRPHVVDTSLNDGYLAMAADKAREADAMEWCNALAGDMLAVEDAINPDFPLESRHSRVGGNL